MNLSPQVGKTLLTRIASEGAVISELPCGSPPTKWRFLQRNRLIAAASQATVVLEAGWRSGSLNTAGHAAQLGRPLGAVPGPVTSVASAGCHRLIREFDAELVTNAEQMAELVSRSSLEPGETAAPAERADLIERSRTRTRDGSPALEPTADQTRVLDALSARSPRQTGDIAARAGLSVASVQSILGSLEIEAMVGEKERGWVKSQ